MYTKLTTAQKRGALYPANLDGLSPTEADAFLLKMRLCLKFVSAMTNGATDGTALVACFSELAREGWSLHMIVDCLNTTLRERVVKLKLLVAKVTGAAGSEMLNATQTWAVAIAHGLDVPFALILSLIHI